MARTPTPEAQAARHAMRRALLAQGMTGADAEIVLDLSSHALDQVTNAMMRVLSVVPDHLRVPVAAMVAMGTQGIVNDMREVLTEGGVTILLVRTPEEMEAELKKRGML